MNWDQLIILLFGGGAVFVSQSSKPRIARYGCLLALVAQPAWFYAAWVAGQWGIFLSAGLYTFSWLRGVKTHWWPVVVFHWARYRVAQALRR